MITLVEHGQFIRSGQKAVQTVLTPFDLFCAETLLRIEPEWVQNVAILCQNGQFGTTFPSALQMEDFLLISRLAPK